MSFPLGIRDWASRVIASETAVDPFCTESGGATLRVYEKLRRQLCTTVGIGSFQALASRALSLSQSQSPKLRTLYVTADGGLHGFGSDEVQLDIDKDVDAGVLFIAQLLGLFLTLLGEATTMRLIADTGLQFKAALDLDTTQAVGPGHFGPFEDILLEAEHLRGMSARLEILADRHVGIDEVLSLAGNIRSIATVLDVLTLLRNKTGGSQDDLHSLSTKGYIN